MTSARTSSRRCGITVFQKSATLSNTRRNAGLGQGHGVTRDLLLEFVQLGQHGIGVDLHRFQLFELVELRLQCVALEATIWLFPEPLERWRHIPGLLTPRVSTRTRRTLVEPLRLWRRSFGRSTELRCLREQRDAACVYCDTFSLTRLNFDRVEEMGIEADTTVTILDHLDNIQVPGDVFGEAVNEYWALICLRDGMEFLYQQALRCDEAVKREVNPGGNVRFFGGGNLPPFSQISRTLLTCAFHWYAISACQYVRTVGAIACKQDPNRPLPHAYADGIIPEVVAFRDKVAAHFAWSTENRRDNDAERLASILPPLTFNSDSFYVGGMTVAVRRNGKASTSEAIKPWSLCKVHEGLRARYWPNQQSRHASHVEKNAQPKDAAEGGEGRLGVVASSLARRLMEDVHLSRGGRS